MLCHLHRLMVQCWLVETQMSSCMHSLAVVQQLLSRCSDWERNPSATNSSCMQLAISTCLFSSACNKPHLTLLSAGASIGVVSKARGACTNKEDVWSVHARPAC
jgi:hypothetical protein